MTNDKARPCGLGELADRVESLTGADRILIYEALRFYFWAAGQGISPDFNQDCLEPEEAFFQFTLRTGDEDWETIAERYRASETGA